MVIPVGVDIGNDKCVVTFLNEKGVVDVVYDESSSRETPLLIHFDKKQRLFGSAGVPYSSSNPKASISQLKRLIGRRFDEPSFQKERALLPYDTSQGPNGEVLVNVTYCGADRTFTAVQLMGMFLSHLKKKAEGRLGSEISQCVIGIPSYLTDKQRRDYLLAAEIAGLKPLRLFHDGTATALDYCYFRNLPYGEATHVVFVDIGHSDTQVTVVRFNCETINVLAHYFDRDLGGRNFTDAIFRFFAEKIKRKHDVDVCQNAKQSHRLRRECDKAKKTLSVNTMAPINIDSLTNDTDLEDKITREEFEERLSDLLGGVVIACDRALDDAGLVTDDVHSVELCGSGSRIPKISQRLKDFFGKSIIISRTLNSSECVANGCALQCGMLCPDFQLQRKFGVQDIFPFYVGFGEDNDSSFASSNIIAKGQFLQETRLQILHPWKVVTNSCAIETTKLVAINRAIEKELPSDSWENVNKYKMDVVPESEKRDLEFRFQFDLHGILRVQSVSLIYDDHPQPKTSEAMKIDVKDEGRLTPQSLEGPIKGSKSTRKRVEFTDSFCGAGNEIVSDARRLEEELAGKDRANERAKERRNDVEALLSDIRGKLSSLGGFGTAFKGEVSGKLDEIEGWLYGPGEDESEMAYSKKLEELELARKALLATHEEAKKSCDELLDYVKKVKFEFREVISRDEYKEIREELLHGEVLLGQNLLPKKEYNDKLMKLKSITQPIEDSYKVSGQKMISAALNWGKSLLSGKSSNTRDADEPDKSQGSTSRHTVMQNEDGRRNTIQLGVEHPESGASGDNSSRELEVSERTGVWGPPQPNNAHVVRLADAIKWCMDHPQQPCPTATVGTITEIFWFRGYHNRCFPYRLNENTRYWMRVAHDPFRMLVQAQLTQEEQSLRINTYDGVAERLLGATISDLLKLEKALVPSSQQEESTYPPQMKRIAQSRQGKEITFHLVYYPPQVSNANGEFVATSIQ